MPAYESIADFIHDAYVFPAARRGSKQVRICVFDVWRGLGGARSLAEIHEVLASEKFRKAYALAPVPRQGSVWSLPTEYAFDLKGWRSPAPSPRESTTLDESRK